MLDEAVTPTPGEDGLQRAVPTPVLRAFRVGNGDADPPRSVLPHLDSEDAIVKKEAINTLRVIVDGKKPLPLKELTAFRLPQLISEWKARL